MKAGALKEVVRRLQVIDAALAASLYFGLDRNNHTLSLGLLICWIGIRCSQQICKTRNNKNWTEATLPSILVFGLTAFHARTIIALDDKPGGSLYILISALIYLGSLYSSHQKKLLLRWISGASIAINSKILIEGAAAGHNLLNKAWMVDINNNIHAMGFGRINSLASMIAFFTIIAFYGLRTDNDTPAKALYAATFISGYFLCWQSNSEMALGAPPLAATAAFLICRKDYLRKGTQKIFGLIAIGAITLACTILTWQLSFKRKTLVFLNAAAEGKTQGVGEHWRIEQWNCWLNNSIFAGNNKMVHGIGFNLKNISQICNNNNPDGGLTQFVSQHGFLGVLALVLLLALVIKSIFQLREIEFNSNATSGWLRCRWSEAALGTMATVLLCNFITPSYSGSYLNASLTGLIFSLGIFTAPTKELEA